LFSLETRLVEDRIWEWGGENGKWRGGKGVGVMSSGEECCICTSSIVFAVLEVL